MGVDNGTSTKHLQKNICKNPNELQRLSVILTKTSNPSNLICVKWGGTKKSFWIELGKIIKNFESTNNKKFTRSYVYFLISYLFGKILAKN